MTTMQSTQEVGDHWVQSPCVRLARPTNAMLSCAADPVELTR